MSVLAWHGPCWRPLWLNSTCRLLTQKKPPVLALTRHSYKPKPKRRFCSRQEHVRSRTCRCQVHKVKMKPRTDLQHLACHCCLANDVPNCAAKAHSALQGHPTRQKCVHFLQGLNADMSLSPGTKSSKAAKHRHALFSDFLLTMPFGIVNAAAGFISLLFKV